MDDRIGYRRKSKFKVIRTTHQIGLRVNLSAWAFKGWLAKVPDEATLTCIEEEDDGDTILSFVEEAGDEVE